MNRSAFLFGGLAAIAAAPAVAGDNEIPVEMRGGRFFAIPRVADGRTFACWLDTDGGGFIFGETVDSFHLAEHATSGKRRATLPAFMAPSIPPLGGTGDLPVFERGAQERADPILAGFDAQLGATWFANRTWRLDWRAARCTMLAAPLSASDANASLLIVRGYPRITAIVDGEPVPMSFDIAASLARNDAARGSQPPVIATTFITRALFERWHAAHPEWLVRRNVGVPAGIDEIIVPEIRLGSVPLSRVACTTRPGDDVFEGEDVSGKLGANAYAGTVAILDYRTSRLRLVREETFVPR